MTAGLALLPPAVVLAAILGLRLSGLAAAGLACLSAVAIWLGSPFVAPTSLQAANALADAALLTVIVAAMIVPGMLFVETTRRVDAPGAIQRLVGALTLPRPQAAILIAVGIGVLVESLTGMGVSLLVTMPLLLRLVDRRAAIGLGLVGMSLMPWGALSLSGIVGAKLAGLPIESLAAMQALVSGAVAFVLPLLCLGFVPAVSWRDVAAALAAGFAMVAAIAAATAWIGIELAGVAGGLAVLAVLGLTAPRTGLAAALRAPGLRPYAILILAVVAQKLALVWLTAIDVAPTLATGRVQFALLSTPGVALLAATWLAAGRDVDRAVVATTAARAWRPLASIALFMLAARCLIESGAVAALGRVVAGFGEVGALLAIVGLGALSGFVTGSGVTGNALFMPSAAAAGSSLGHLPLFATLQSSAASHAAMASLPIAAILLATLPGRTNDDDRQVLLTGLRLLTVVSVGLAAAGLGVLAWS
jgi:lactate permease